MINHMIKRRKLIHIAAVASVVGLALSGPLSAQDYSDERLRVGLAVNLPTLDPHFTSAAVTRQISMHIFETLLSYDENYEIAPMLADSFSVSEDGLETVLRLRSGLLFHDGSAVTPEDVVASIRRWMQLSTVGRSTFDTVSDIVIRGNEIVIQTSTPSSVMLEALASPTQAASIMPAAIAEAAGVNQLSEFIGTGPYRLDEWRQDQFVILTRFDDYVALDSPPSGLTGAKHALVKDIEFHFATNVPSRVAGLESGTYDVIDDVPPDNYDTLAGVSSVDLHVGIPSRMNIMFMNNRHGPLTDVKVRQAINRGLDLDSIMLASAVRDEFYRIDPGLMFREQTTWYSDAGSDNINLKDIEGAKILLEEAGYAGEPIRILASREFQYLYRAALVIQQQMTDMGLNAILEVYDWPTLLQRRSDAEAWDIFFTFASIYPHPSQVTYIDSRKQYPGWYSNPEVDSLLDELNASASNEHARELFHQVQEIYRTEVPSIKLGDMHGIVAARDYVQGFEYFYDIKFWNVSVER